MRKFVRFRSARPQGPWDSVPPKRQLVTVWTVVAAAAAGGMLGYVLFDLVLPATDDQVSAVHVTTTSAEPVSGQASVIDGDTLEVHGTRVRLYGIDAPESGQLCVVEAREVRCGQQAALALSDRIGWATVNCVPRDIDRYGRTVAVCSVGGDDLNAWMVSQGWAMAYRQYSSDYVQQEIAASQAKAGIWAGQFVAPWDWRRGERMPADTSQRPGDCTIKGNISSKGERIYHVPGGQYYSRTRISPDKGELWFCTEAEAQAAGWRRSKR